MPGKRATAVCVCMYEDVLAISTLFDAL